MMMKTWVALAPMLLFLLLFSCSLHGEDVAVKGGSGVFNDDLLEKLTGTWDLNGTMGKTQLHHQVAVEWTLNHQFLKIHSTDVKPETGKTPYESLYYVGWNSNKKQYVMHLLDVFGGEFSETLGFGIRKADSICFSFEYKDAHFENTFTYHSPDDSWEMVLKFKDEKKEWKEFARKRLTRKKL